MLASAQDDDDHHSMQTTKQNSLTHATNNSKLKFQDKMEGFPKQIVSHSSNLSAFFQTTTNLLKIMDAHMTTLIQKL